MTENSIDDTLAARASNYGDYAEGSRVGQNILNAMKDSTGWERLTDDQKESLYMIAHKIRRIVNGNAEHYDSWHDIAGYAQLSATEVLKREGLNKRKFSLDEMATKALELLHKKIEARKHETNNDHMP